MKRKLSRNFKRVAAGLCAVPMISSVMPSQLMSSAFTAIVMANETYTEPQTETIDEKTYYDISSANDLLWAKQQIESGNKAINLILKDDIDLSGTEWSSIGVIIKEEVFTYNNCFEGTFDGNGHKISGLKVSGDRSSLFFQTESSAVIKNIVIDGFELDGNGDGNIGAVVQTNSGNVNNCRVINSTISNGERTGGIVGVNRGQITDCKVNASTITGVNNVGGIAGINDGKIKGCINTSAVSGKEYVAGIAGWFSSGEISDCVNSAAINASDSHIGGIAGIALTNTTVKNCTNSGAVNAAGIHVAGIVGDQSGDVINCTNTGAVTSEKGRVGGIAGMLNAGSISGCLNTGNVSGSINVGGLAGAGSMSTSSISSSISKATVTATDTNTVYVGGIIGLMTNSSVSNCYTNSSNLVGYMQSATVDEKSAASVTDERFASGEICYLLNSSDNEDEDVWYQTLTEDSVPVLDNTHKKVISGGETYRNYETEFALTFDSGSSYNDMDYVTRLDVNGNNVDKEDYDKKIPAGASVAIASKAKLSFETVYPDVEMTSVTNAEVPDIYFLYTFNMPESGVKVSHTHKYVSKLDDDKKTVLAGCEDEIGGLSAAALLTAESMAYNPNTGYTGAKTELKNDWITGIGAVSGGDISIYVRNSQAEINKTNGKYELPVGSYNASSTVYVGSEIYELSADFEVTAKNINDQDITVDISSTGKTYDGKKPDFTLTAVYGDTTLTKGVDYDVAVEPDSAAIGKYTVTVTGKGNYTGSRSFDYDITTASVSDAIAFEAKDAVYSAGAYSSDNFSFSADSDVAQALLDEGTKSYKYYSADKVNDNADLTFTDSLTYGEDHYCGETLRYGRWLNYGVTYTSAAVGKGYLIINCYTTNDNGKLGGWKEVHLKEINLGLDGTIRGKDENNNEVTCYLDSGLNYAAEEHYSYVALMKRESVIDGLDERAQFIASANISDNADGSTVPADAGKYVAVATIHDPNGNYSDVTKSDAFEITPAPVTVSASRNSTVYSVTALADIVKAAEISGLKGSDKVSSDDKDTLIALYNGETAVTDTYPDVGTYTFGINEETAAKYPNYEFSVSSTDNTLTINPFSINETSVSFFTFNIDKTALTYNGKDQSPAFTGNNTRTGPLVEGTDYTVSTAVEAGEHTAVVTGTGNYTGTREFNYTIAPAQIGDVQADAPVTYTGNDDPQAGHIKVFGADGDGDGNADVLTEGVDYELRYTEGVLVGDAAAAYETAYESIKDVNTYTVIAKGIGNYKGYSTGNFVIAQGEADGSHFDVTFNNGEEKKYNDVAVERTDFTLTANDSATPAEREGDVTVTDVKYAKFPYDDNGILNEGDILKPGTVYELNGATMAFLGAETQWRAWPVEDCDSVTVDEKGVLHLYSKGQFHTTYTGNKGQVWKVTTKGDDHIEPVYPEYTSEAPKDAGTYLAEITASGKDFTNVTAYKVFDIEKVNANVKATGNTDVTWGKLLSAEDIFETEGVLNTGAVLEQGKVYTFDDIDIDFVLSEASVMNGKKVRSVKIDDDGHITFTEATGMQNGFNFASGKVWVVTSQGRIECLTAEEAAEIVYIGELPLGKIFTVTNGDTEYDFTDSANNDAGEYTITVDEAYLERYNNGDHNYIITVADDTFSPLTVAQKSVADGDVTVTIEPESYDYNGNVRTVSVSAAVDIEEHKGLTKATKEYTLALGTASDKGADGYYSGTTSAYKAGEWTVNVVGLNNFKDRTSKTWNVDNAEFGDINITNTNDFSSYYSAEPHVTDEFVKSNTKVYNVGNTLISSDDEELILTVAYYAYSEATSDYTTALDSAPVDAGKYKATVTAEYPNHNTDTASVIYEIKKAGIDLTFNEFDLKKPLGYTDRNVRYTYKVQKADGTPGEETAGTLQIPAGLTADYEITNEDMKDLTDIYDLKNYEYSLGENYTVDIIGGHLTAVFVNSNLDAIYSGKPYEDPEVTITDDAGREITDADVVYDYYKGTPDGNGGYSFEYMFSNDKPENVGHYRVNVSADYNGTANPNILEAEFDIDPVFIYILFDNKDLVKPVGYKDGTVKYTYMLSSDKDENGDLIEHEGSIAIPLGQTEPYTITKDDFADIADMLNSDNYRFWLQPDCTVTFSTARPVSASAKTSFISADEPYVTPEITILDENGDVYNGEYTLVGTDEAGKAGVYSETVVTDYNGEQISFDFNWIVALKGDVNLDGTVDDKDAALVLIYQHRQEIYKL